MGALIGLGQTTGSTGGFDYVSFGLPDAKL